MKDQIPLGITDDEVALGSHLIHFWQNEEEFERGVRFLEPGIANESQYCVLIGHDEANQRVLPLIAFSVWSLLDTRKFGRKPGTALMDSISSTKAETFASQRTFAIAIRPLVPT
jgi:hypothetical protein